MNNLDTYKQLATTIRRTVLELIYRTKSPHVGPSLSIVEIMVALYFKQMNLPAGNPVHPERDRFILSKGHACATLYAVLAERGLFDKKDLDGFAVDDGIFEHHPTRDPQRGIEISTGSLGHGLSFGVGMALAGKTDNNKYRVYTLLGDGETNEGSVWEAAMFAGHHRLDNLVALIDYNKLQGLGCTRDIIDLEPLMDKWKSFGWHAQSIDGHDFAQIFRAMASLSAERPNVIVLNTVKGKGVSFMENKLLWHYRTPDDNEYTLALRELTE
jgi:transketolase